MAQHDAHISHAAVMDHVYRHQRHIYDFTRKYYLFGRDRLIRELDAAAGAALVEVGCGTGLLAAAAKAANVTWQNHQRISGASDVDTTGAYFASWAPYLELTPGAGPLTVNAEAELAGEDLACGAPRALQPNQVFNL